MCDTFESINIILIFVLFWCRKVLLSYSTDHTFINPDRTLHAHTGLAIHLTLHLNIVNEVRHHKVSSIKF